MNSQTRVAPDVPAMNGRKWDLTESAIPASRAEHVAPWRSSADGTDGIEVRPDSVNRTLGLPGSTSTSPERPTPTRYRWGIGGRSGRALLRSSQASSAAASATSMSASSLVTRRISTKFACTAGSPIASSRWFFRNPSRVSSASAAAFCRR